MSSSLKKIILSPAKKLFSSIERINPRLYYGTYIRFRRHPKILSIKETIKKVKDGKLSLARFGDGEINWMCNLPTNAFQKNSDELSKELTAAFSSRNKKLLITLSSPMINPKPFNNFCVCHWGKFVKSKFAAYDSYIDYSYSYGDTHTSRFYMDFKDKSKKRVQPIVDGLKELWNERNVIFVEGAHTRLGAGNDLFDGAKSIRRIVCPDNDAYFKIDEIESAVKKNYNEDDLIILALGPTATVLAWRFTEKYSMQALDLGHIDVEYLWYINGAKEKMPIVGKNVFEAKKGEAALKIDFDEAKYKSEIIAEIK